MKLYSMRVERDWQTQAYTVKIQYDDPKGSVEVNLQPEVSDELLKFIGPMLNKFSLNCMADLQQSILNGMAAVQPKEQAQ